jgi:hypothetical protein
MHECCDVDRLAGIAEIAGEHRRDLAKPRRAFEVLHEGGELVRVRNDARRRPVAGMPGQQHGRHRPDRMAERFERKDRCPVADRTARHVARYDDHRPRRFDCATIHSVIRPKLLVPRYSPCAR